MKTSILISAVLAALGIAASASAATDDLVDGEDDHGVDFILG